MRLRTMTCVFMTASMLGACAGAESDAPPSSSTAAGAGSRPNIVIVLVDDLRWDEMGVTGHPYAETPNIDRLAADFIVGVDNKKVRTFDDLLSYVESKKAGDTVQLGG